MSIDRPGKARLFSAFLSSGVFALRSHPREIPASTSGVLAGPRNPVTAFARGGKGGVRREGGGGGRRGMTGWRVRFA